MQGKYYNGVYYGEMRDSRMDREDQLETMDDWEEAHHRQLAAMEAAVEAAQLDLEAHKQWLAGRAMFREALVESLK
jgi:hypothetical protein